MFRKSTILSLAAAASLGVLAISTTEASAVGHFGGARFTAARASAARAAPRFTFRQNFAIRRIGFPKLYPPHPKHWNFGWWWWKHHHQHWVYGAPVYASPVYASPVYSSAPTSNTCNCLTKSYTQDGAVVFKDVCTNEMAMNPPAADTAPQAPASELQPPQPQQQGYLQPQPMQ